MVLLFDREVVVVLKGFIQRYWTLIRKLPESVHMDSSGMSEYASEKASTFLHSIW